MKNRYQQQETGVHYCDGNTCWLVPVVVSRQTGPPLVSKLTTMATCYKVRRTWRDIFQRLMPDSLDGSLQC